MNRTTARPPSAATLPVVTLVALLAACPLLEAATSLPFGAFEVRKEIEISGTPVEIYDAFTKETLNWWDQFHSVKPKDLYFEARPGGGFIEIFDDEGNGALHGTVIFAQRGRRLRWTGPMGYSGMALEMVHSLDLDVSDRGGTRLVLTVRGVGQLEPSWAESIDRVWDHFLVERFKPYMEGKYWDQNNPGRKPQGESD